MYKNRYLIAVLVLVLVVLLASCSADEPEESITESSANPAMVDGVEVVTQNEQQYAIVIGFYPDPCTRISDVDQVVEGDRISITLSTASPEDLMCAQMLTAFEISLLLETGGLLAGEYTVEVNDRETSFSLGQ